MKPSYLIQRLEPPTGGVNPFSFGGGYVNGGFSENAMKILKDVMSFDYMGAAEFEFGAVPEAFRKMYDNKDKLKCYSKEVPYSYKSWNPKATYKGKIPVYVICNEADKDEVYDRIEKLAKDEYALQLKERTFLNRSMANEVHKQEKYHIPCGWVELDNGFMFFTNETMFNNVSNIFGLTEVVVC